MASSNREATQFQWGFFLSAKQQTKNKILELVTNLKAGNNVTVKTIRCDNAGQNRVTQTLTYVRLGRE